MARAYPAERYPRHNVKIAKPFAVGKFEVTWDDWEACVAMGGCDGRPTGDAGSGKERLPLINVSWHAGESLRGLALADDGSNRTGC